jgi:hypothetical protein
MRNALRAGDRVGRPSHGFPRPKGNSTQLGRVPEELSMVKRILARRRGPLPISYHPRPMELEATGMLVQLTSMVWRIRERRSVCRLVLRSEQTVGR